MICLALIGVVIAVIGLGDIIIKLAKPDYNIDYISVAIVVLTGVILTIPLLVHATQGG